MPSHIALNDSNAYTAAGLAGLGIVQMTHFMLAPLLEQGKMVELLSEWESDPLPIHVIYPPNRHLSAKVRVFVEWVADMFTNHPATQLKGKNASPSPRATLTEAQP